jgi:hypothetical protein
LDVDTKSEPKAETREPKVHRGEPTIDVGSAVHYLDEDAVCHVVTIDGDDVEIEDNAGEKYDVQMGELSLAQEDESDSGDWNDGDRCVVEIDGEDYAGTIKTIKGDNAIVLFDDGDKDTYPLDDLKEEGVDEPEDAPKGLDVGDRVTVNIDGEDYPGEIVALTEDGNAAIKFDDGDKDTYPMDQLTVEEVAPSDPSEPDTKKPQCFGDKDLYGANDAECKECGFYGACGGEVKLSKAGVGKSEGQQETEAKEPKGPSKKAKKVKKAKKSAKKATSSKADDDIVAGIIG